MKTYFSWKLFKIKIQDSQIDFDFNFDTKEADKFIFKEKEFIKKLNESGANYRYLKIIPDDLPKMFWEIDTSLGTKKFVKDVENYFLKVNPKTEVITFSEILEDDKQKKLYKKVYQKIYTSFDKNYQSPFVDPVQFTLETKLRSTYYTNNPLSIKESRKLARKSFSLFAAETAVLCKMPNMILLVGERSKNTYKYDFYKFPKNRPMLKKLFVI